MKTLSPTILASFLVAGLAMAGSAAHAMMACPPRAYECGSMADGQVQICIENTCFPGDIRYMGEDEFNSYDGPEGDRKPGKDRQYDMCMDESPMASCW